METPYFLWAGPTTPDYNIYATVAELAEHGIEPEKPPYRPGGRTELGPTCFRAGPDGYRIELIHGGEFPTPQD